VTKETVHLRGYPRPSGQKLSSSHTFIEIVHLCIIYCTNYVYRLECVEHVNLKVRQESAL
jgi:hypothetical protein